MLNDDESKSTSGKIANGFHRNGVAKTNGHAGDILANGGLRNGTGDHVESAKKRL